MAFSVPTQARKKSAQIQVAGCLKMAVLELVEEEEEDRAGMRGSGDCVCAEW